jgi:DNA-binding SARP family transcriptional activator
VSLRLLWLGHPQVEQEGHSVRFERRKALALLAYLSLERRAHSPEALATLFWPASDPEHALRNLRRTLSSLNESLGPAWAECSPDTLRLQPEWAYWLDVDAFHRHLAQAANHDHTDGDVCVVCCEALEQAVHLHRGDFLEGFTLPGCPAFENWQLAHRERLRRELAQALAMLADHRAAIRQYETCRQTLAAELGQPPDRTATALYEATVPAGPRHELAGPLIRSKLRLPFTRAKLVSRPRLAETFGQGLRTPLTLIAAPAGFGKTTLVASCVSAWACPVAWLSLDENDNHAPHFLSYLVAALQEADPAIASEAAQMLAAVQPLSPETVLASLVDDLEVSDRNLVLVLDDYQFIRNPAVHRAVAFLVEHGPPSFHLLIASRSDPPLPLTRLRARGQLVELRTADLSFSEPETAQFLNGIMGLGLDDTAIAALASRTEGWIAGLQMAALSLRARADAPAFIRAFSGTNRYILDYLLEEVLANQPPHIQRFLLVTSILDRLSAPLCDALLDAAAGESWPGGAPAAAEKPPVAGQSATILAYLEQANAFLLPLDDQRIWYRYHHLFADLLRAELQRALGSSGRRPAARHRRRVARAARLAGRGHSPCRPRP